MRMAVLPAQRIASARRIGQDVARGLTFLAVLIGAAVAPLLPPIAWKVKATLLAALLLAGAFYLRARTEGSVGRSPLDRPVGALLAAAALATIFSPDRLVSLYPSPLRGEGLLTLVAYLLVALAAARLKGREITAVITLVLVSATLVGVVALAQYFGADVLGWVGFGATDFVAYVRPGTLRVGVVPVPLGPRSYSTLGNPLFLGGYAALLLPINIVLAIRAPGRAWWAYGLATIVLTGGLVASQTRAAWLATAVGTVLLLRWLPRSRLALRRVAILAIGAAALTTIMALTRPEALLLHRAASTVEDFQGIGGETLRQRLYTWKHTLPLIAQRPILGWGFSGLLGRFPDLGSPEYRRLFGDDVVQLIDNPHNELLHVAFSTGLVGLGAYLWVWGTVALLLIRATRRRTIIPGLLDAFLTALLVYSIWMQSAWSHIGIANVFWTSLGLAVAIARQDPFRRNE